MPQPNTLARRAREAAAFLAAGLAVAGALAGYYLAMTGEALIPRPLAFVPHAPPALAPVGTGPDLLCRCPGIRLPPARPAGGAPLGDEAEVIGVCAGGRSRAYLVEALTGVPTRHVVNDQVGGHAVSVTYCERSGCSRAFTEGSAAAPLPLDVAGWLHNGMALHAGDEDYSQETGECLSHPGSPGIPYAELPHKRTPWRAWRQAHPDTDVYVGDPPQEQGPAGQARGG
jgi:hypothetical protein